MQIFDIKDLVIEISRHLDICSLSRLMRVNKYIFNIISTSNVWLKYEKYEIMWKKSNLQYSKCTHLMRLISYNLLYSSCIPYTYDKYSDEYYFALLMRTEPVYYISLFDIFKLTDLEVNRMQQFMQTDILKNANVTQFMNILGNHLHELQSFLVKYDSDFLKKVYISLIFGSERFIYFDVQNNIEHKKRLSTKYREHNYNILSRIEIIPSVISYYPENYSFSENAHFLVYNFAFIDYLRKVPTKTFQLGAFSECLGQVLYKQSDYEKGKKNEGYNDKLYHYIDNISGRIGFETDYIINFIIKFFEFVYQTF